MSKHCERNGQAKKAKKRNKMKGGGGNLAERSLTKGFSLPEQGISEAATGWEVRRRLFQGELRWGNGRKTKR